MKRFVAASLLLGYVMLVPFCFFGGMMVASAHAMNMPSNSTHSMSDCGMALGGCAQGMDTNGVDDAMHHVGMYNTITQTPLSGVLMTLTLVTLFFLLAFGLPSYWYNTLHTQQSFHSTRGLKNVKNSSEQRILTWLSLFELSPNGA